MEPLPVLTSYTDEERQICKYQQGFASRLRQSPYYVIEQTKTDGEHFDPNSINSGLVFLQNFPDTQINIDHLLLHNLR